MQLSIVSDGTAGGTRVTIDGVPVAPSAVSFEVTLPEGDIEKSLSADVWMPRSDPAIEPTSEPTAPAPSWGAPVAPADGEDSPPTTPSPGALKTER